jgi:hypothetical protein
MQPCPCPFPYAKLSQEHINLAQAVRLEEEEHRVRRTKGVAEGQSLA